MSSKDSATLVITLGQGGYDVAFADAVESQRQYCINSGYKYYCVSSPGSPLLGRENIWLKVFLIYGALLKNDHILYLDTDVRVRPTCPPIDQAVSDTHPIGVVEGHSGRVNAGVIIARSNPESRAFFAKWLASLGKPIAARHDVGWGENGHLIRLVEEHNIKPIDTRWNNTFASDLDDYMRHYTGPLRNEYEFVGDAKEAWNKIKEVASASKEVVPLDITSSFTELKEIYSRSAPIEYFATFDECWATIRELVFPIKDVAGKTENWNSHVFIAEEISESSSNAYVVTLKDGLDTALPPENVTTGVASFWDHNFISNDILHIEWIESLFSWKIPTERQLSSFERRIKEIAAKSPIVYTAHNFDLMPTYGENRQRLMQSLADHCSMICHLSDANIDPYNKHHAEIEGLQTIPTAVVPHGDYQPYFRTKAVPFEDPALQTEKIKILVFGHIRTEQELSFCLEVGKQLGEDQYQMIFTGVINPDIIHWKEIHSYQNEWVGGPRRIHFKVPHEKVVSLVTQSDGLLIPRFDRLNSGVQFLAYSLLKPAFVPSQNSMGNAQNRAFGEGVYSPNNPVSAAEVIRKNFESGFTNRMIQKFRINTFNYAEQDVYAVGAAHKSAYQTAIDFHQQYKTVRAA